MLLSPRLDLSLLKKRGHDLNIGTRSKNASLKSTESSCCQHSAVRMPVEEAWLRRVDSAQNVGSGPVGSPTLSSRPMWMVTVTKTASNRAAFASTETASPNTNSCALAEMWLPGKLWGNLVPQTTLTDRDEI